MNERLPTIDTLIVEIARYLVAVELFRTERCEPTLRPELVRHTAEAERIRVDRTLVYPAH